MRCEDRENDRGLPSKGVVTTPLTGPVDLSLHSRISMNSFFIVSPAKACGCARVHYYQGANEQAGHHIIVGYRFLWTPRLRRNHSCVADLLDRNIDSQ
ncbi:hypothetical protein EVAR_90830_1 [Eumeta japonica]|uniref:Uncharacterized protein n=1 Tax=Eumeta variegata TaxID=151549 RepID=A0A4C1ZYC7_EUMVA|nr:hypothetical protein EVAR_90830_1 [Eumeta japonica]